VSGDGRYVAFTIGCGGPMYGTFTAKLLEFDRQRSTLRTVTSETIGCTIDCYGEPRYTPRYSADGNAIVYARDTSAHSTCGDSSVVVSERVPRYGSGVIAQRPCDNSLDTPDISGDGRFVALRWLWTAPNVPTFLTFIGPDIEVLDRASSPPSGVLASATNSDTAAHGAADSPAIDDDGGVVAFTSSADDLAPVDRNGVDDVFTRLRATALAFPTDVVAGDGPTVTEPANGPTTTVFMTVIDPVLRDASETVRWRTRDGTATAPTDYTAGNGTITLTSDGYQMTGSIALTVRGDNVVEGPEAFHVELAGPTGFQSVGQRTVTILDHGG
jgi:Calx-beta domain